LTAWTGTTLACVTTSVAVGSAACEVRRHHIAVATAKGMFAEGGRSPGDVYAARLTRLSDSAYAGYSTPARNGTDDVLGPELTRVPQNRRSTDTTFPHNPVISHMTTLPRLCENVISV
jgi:hypothetical protein